MAGTFNMDDVEKSDVTRKDLRQKIAVMVGCKPSKTQLKKSTLNSVYAYLEGEFCYPRKVRYDSSHPEYIPLEGVQEAVVYASGVGAPHDEWSPIVDGQPGSFRKDELWELATKLHEEDDQRDWVTPDG